MDMKKIYEILKKLSIEYEEIAHKPVLTVQEAKNIDISGRIEGIGCKNLFLKDKKKYYLVILQEDKRADIKALSELLATSHLSFASATRLKETLDLEPGGVTPLGIINDSDNKVLLLIDRDLKGKRLLFHPNTNTKTLSIAYDDLIKFIEFENHKYIEI